MTKKHYELIAQALQHAKPSLAVMPPTIPAEARNVYHMGRMHAWDNTCKTTADYLATTNSKFDRAKFLEACGVAE